MQKHVAIFSHEDDLHSLAILNESLQDEIIKVHIIGTNSLLLRGGFTWDSKHSDQGFLKTSIGNCIDPSSLDLIWWRRPHLPLDLPTESMSVDHVNFAAAEWKWAINGLLQSTFRGKWVNHPTTELLASNKLHQLQIAKKLGFKIPATLISQDPHQILRFCEEHGGKIIIKKIYGTYEKQTLTCEIELEDIRNNPNTRLCPAIYQQKIDSNIHIRANCFGEKIHSFIIKSRILDWRADLTSPMENYALDNATESMLISFLKYFNLRMGVFDLILRDNEIVFLEINPQGQFLFCEALTSTPLRRYFYEFLLSEV
ncbi:hypothetical protein [Burkholderia cepacia]|uniref:hypothetical protein n=1 Tax=Burkholderia cepacia TaxID=292 RepID=UPI000A729CCC|nr:hypothetical protein [Burkholderia cepacia]